MARPGRKQPGCFRYLDKPMRAFAATGELRTSKPQEGDEAETVAHSSYCLAGGNNRVMSAIWHKPGIRQKPSDVDSEPEGETPIL